MQFLLFCTQFIVEKQVKCYQRMHCCYSIFLAGICSGTGVLVSEQVAWGLGKKLSVIMEAQNQQSGQLASYRFILSITFGKLLSFSVLHCAWFRRVLVRLLRVHVTEVLWDNEMKSLSHLTASNVFRFSHCLSLVMFLKFILCIVQKLQLVLFSVF